MHSTDHASWLRVSLVSSPSIDHLDQQTDWSLQSLTALLRSNIVPVEYTQEITLFAEDIDAQVAALDVQLKALNAQRAALVWRAAAAHSLLSPVRLLPDELLLHIFSFIYHFDLPYGSPSLPICIASVCKRWHDVVYSTPSLWCNLRFPLPGHPGDVPPLSIIDTWVERSLPMPLKIQLGHEYSPFPAKHRCLELVSNLHLYGWRIQALRLFLDRRHFTLVNALPHDSFPVLEELALGIHDGTWCDELVTPAFTDSLRLRRFSLIMHLKSFCDVNRILPGFPFPQITDVFIRSTSPTIFSFLWKLESLRTATLIANGFYRSGSPFTALVSLPIETLELEGRYVEFAPFLLSFSLPRLREFSCNLTDPWHTEYGLFDAHARTLQHFIARSTSLTRLAMRNMQDESMLPLFEDPHTFESVEEFKIGIYKADLLLWPRFMKMLAYHRTSSVSPLFPRLREVEFDIRLNRQQETELERIDESLAAMILSRYTAARYGAMQLLERCHYRWEEYAGMSTAREHFLAQLQSCFDNGLVMEGFA
ncbi:hypothetical protein FISHEDRAFT_74173 [Fistulina hepatica ATCC 64428]|uniref:F-box domain-containing protein n=1 Tax=Fistulina hepatica ATCC 64428 TaxID=1128425 RepID=A0A0D7AAT7_9AGAR|nr:hypothetical protein FISHEDRAFT_74173 [Fistulina hepatica ATCC 64428]